MVRFIFTRLKVQISNILTECPTEEEYRLCFLGTGELPSMAAKEAMFDI